MCLEFPYTFRKTHLFEVTVEYNEKHKTGDLKREQAKQEKAIFLELKVWRAKQVKPFCKILCKRTLSRRHIHSTLQKFTAWDRGQSQGICLRLSHLSGNSAVDTYSLWISQVTGHRITLERDRVKIRDLYWWRRVKAGNNRKFGCPLISDSWKDV